MKLNQIIKFENQNDVSVNVYGFEEGFLELYLLRISKIVRGKSVMLLLIEDDGNNHYVLMQDPSQFVDKKNKGKTYSCKYYLHSSYRKK